MFREARVSGWSAPSTRTLSARARWRYPAARPGWPWLVEEQSGLVEEVGGVLGVGVRWGVAGQGVDVREQHPPARPARRVLPVGEGAGELAGGLVPGVVDRLGVTVGVARVGGAGHGLHQPVHGQGARRSAVSML